MTEYTLPRPSDDLVCSPNHVRAAYAAGLAEGRKVPEVWQVSSRVFSVLFATEAQADFFISRTTPAMGAQKLRLEVLQPAPTRPINCGTGHCSCIECFYKGDANEPR